MGPEGKLEMGSFMSNSHNIFIWLKSVSITSEGCNVCDNDHFPDVKLTRKRAAVSETNDHLASF